MVDKANFLIPPHRKLSAEEINSILEQYELNDKLKLPKIKIKDPALVELGPELGDVIEITRTSFAGKSKYYRMVVD
jgi:DNA-directed RNA polymerase subunit H (RpoH/RPB5)